MTIESLKSFFNHERYQSISILIACVLLIWIYACESTTRSLTDPQLSVTRAQLQVELDALLATADVRFAEIDRQDEFKQTVFQYALITAQTGTINPIGVLTALAAIFGVGATVDNVRNRKKNKIAKSNDH